jgi:hypothetical protein
MSRTIMDVRSWLFAETVAPGFCQCGCGQPTPLADRNHAALGWIKGQPLAYVQRHKSTWAGRARAIKDATTGCWIWQGSKHGSGYGLARFNHKLQRVHRIVWQLEYGAIPAGFHICHRCDTPACCNPEHLFLGTAADNAHDRDRKGRLMTLRGEQNPRAKLTNEQVRYIKSIPRGPWGYGVKMAARLGISPARFHQLRASSHWRHLNPEGFSRQRYA